MSTTSNNNRDSTSRSSKHNLALVISLLISLIIIAYLFSKMDWALVLQHTKKLNAWFFPLLIAGVPLLIWIRALRWRLLLPNRENLTIHGLSDATFVGYFASSVLPLRAGEIIRPWVASRWQPVSFSSAFVSIIIERLADATCMLTLFALCLSYIDEVPVAVQAGAHALGLLTAILLGGVFAAYLFPVRMEKILHGIANRLTHRIGSGMPEKINRMITDCFAGLRVIASVRQLIMVVVLSYVMWISNAVFYQILLWAFGEYPSFWVGMLLNVIVALAVAAPSAPGFIGTFQVGCLIALSTVSGYSEEFAMAYSVVAHAIQMIVIVLIGFVVLQIRGLSFRQMRSIKQTADSN